MVKAHRRSKQPADFLGADGGLVGCVGVLRRGVVWWYKGQSGLTSSLVYRQEQESRSQKNSAKHAKQQQQLRNQVGMN